MIYKLESVIWAFVSESKEYRPKENVNSSQGTSEKYKKRDRIEFNSKPVTRPMSRSEQKDTEPKLEQQSSEPVRHNT